jgi:hypothetical protein
MAASSVTAEPSNRLALAIGHCSRAAAAYGASSRLARSIRIISRRFVSSHLPSENDATPVLAPLLIDELRLPLASLLSRPAKADRRSGLKRLRVEGQEAVGVLLPERTRLRDRRLANEEGRAERPDTDRDGQFAGEEVYVAARLSGTGSAAAGSGIATSGAGAGTILGVGLVGWAAAAGAVWGAAAYIGYRDYRAWRELEASHVASEAMKQHLLDAARRMWQNGELTDEEYFGYVATGNLVIQSRPPPQSERSTASMPRHRLGRFRPSIRSTTWRLDTIPVCVAITSINPAVMGRQGRRTRTTARRCRSHTALDLRESSIGRPTRSSTR